MIAPVLRHALAPVAQQHRRLRFLGHLTAWWALVALVGALGLAAGAHSASWLLLLGSVALGGAIWIWQRAQAWQPDWQQVARRVEERHPELRALLLTAVEQNPEPGKRELNFLQQRVIADTVRLSRQHGWLDTVSPSRWLGVGALQVGALAAMLAVLFFLGPRRVTPAGSAAPKPPVSLDGVEVTPGDTELERGSGLVVLARFLRQVPTEAALVLQPAKGAAQRVPLTKNLDDPAFGGGLPEVDADLTYRVEYAGHATRDFKVRVFEHPRLDRADATLHYPAYTKLPDKSLPDTHRVSAVEGTKLEVAFQLNKPVKSAALVTKDGKETPLAVEAGKPAAFLHGFDVQASQSYEVRLVDADGRTSKTPVRFAIEALPNRRPELKFVTPKGDQRISPIEEVAFHAEAWDDFGLVRYGLTINVDGRGDKEMELGRETHADERRALDHVLKLEEAGVKPDQLVSWFLWAEDIGPDGKPRRTAGDMFFGEVRPFEEIFHPGVAQEGKGQPGSRLGVLQKQVINATWNLKRGQDAASKPPTDTYLKDEPAVRDGQNAVLEKTKVMALEIDDPKTQALAENAIREMQAALDQLKQAEKTPGPLPGALVAEQAAYNALLKLEAHEFNVARAQGQGASKGGDPEERNLDDLELKDDKKRYETKRDAEPPEKAEQRSQLAILNRLKELAQRQQDINERLKELQTALQTARTEPEKEEARRQLKRLREEEQQLLADMDEARQKMEQSTEQAQLADARRQLDETRAEAQKAAESMERNAASQALASGTRTARQLEELKEDFRKKTSGQFNEEMRQMRADARELAEKQQRIADQLKAGSAAPERRTLDGSGERDSLPEQFKRQQEQLAGITEQMKQVSAQAEAAEPLLAKELYDALRKTTQAATDQMLGQAQMLAGRGYPSQARPFEQKAREQIEDLKTGVERAAESVLGNEAEALRQAQAELEALNEQLNREIAQARADLAKGAEGQPPNAQTDQNADSPQPGGAPNAQTGLAQAESSARFATPSARGQTPTPGADASQPSSGASQPSGENSPLVAGGQPSQQQTPGGQPKPGQAPGQSQPSQQGQQTAQRGSPGQGREPGRSPGRDAQGQGQQTAQNGSPGRGQQPGQQPPSQGQSSENGAQPGNPPGNNQTAQAAGLGNGKAANGRQTGGNQASPPDSTAQSTAPQQRQTGPMVAGGGPANGRGGGGGHVGSEEAPPGQTPQPLTGDEFVQWSDRLRNVEEMLDAPALRNEAARIREVAKGMRVEYKQHHVSPNWQTVKTQIGAPLVELRNRLTEELARRESRENLVPIDRDPVPSKYVEGVRRYYEELGLGR